jgi:membrane protease YdiL (CAAX protease family)
MESSLEAAKPAPFWSFRGPDGIRSGWSFLIFLVVYGVLFFGLFTVVRIVFHLTELPKGEIQPSFGLAAEALQLIPVVLAIAIMARIEGRSFGSYGLAAPRAVRLFLVGALGGVACLSLLIAVLYLGGYWSFDGVALEGLSVLTYGLVWFLVFTMTGVVEETLWRGYVQSTLARGLGFWPAAFIGSLLFAFAHMGNPGETLAGLGQVFVAGLLFCLVLRTSGSLWLGIGLHAGWDWGQSYFYGTPDSGFVSAGHLINSHAVGSTLFSGGSAGPEGSLFTLPVLVLGVLVFLWICRRSGLFGATPVPAASRLGEPEPPAGLA